MKTILKFEECDTSKETVILRHRKDVQIYKEVRKFHTPWKGYDVFEDRKYIVIRFPKSKQVDLSKIESIKDRISLGLLITELDEEIEILMYDQFTFTWRIRVFEDAGLFKVSQRRIPNWEEYGELFPVYLNARGIKEISYNVLFILIELPFVVYKMKKVKRVSENKL